MNSPRSLAEANSDLETVAFAVARNQCGAKLPIEEVLFDLGVSSDTFMSLADDPIFQRSVRLFEEEMRQNGISFQMKARLQAEELLRKQWKVIHDPETPPAVIEKMISNTVRWAGLEQRPTAAPEDDGKSAQKIQISINLGRAEEYRLKTAPSEPVTIDVTPTVVPAAQDGP